MQAGGVTFLLFTAAGCRHIYCDDGTKVKDKSECGDLITKIWNMKDLKAFLKQGDRIDNALRIKNVDVEVLGLLVAAELESNEDFEVLQALGALQKKYDGKLTVKWNENFVVPAREGQLLTFAEWNSWNKSPLGANPMPTGAKSAAMWVVGANEYELFGENGASMIKGDPVLDINTNLHYSSRGIKNWV
jgi:hypothetical protein